MDFPNGAFENASGSYSLEATASAVGPVRRYCGNAV